MSALLDCPGIESWQALFAGLLPPDQRAVCERHLESCPLCQARLDQLEETDALLRCQAQRMGDPTVAPRDPTLADVVKRLGEGPFRDTRGQVWQHPASADAADLYFLRPAERAGLLGTLGSYEVQEVIGQGGMGVVLKAFDPALHRLVAIKVLSPALAGSSTARRRFIREAQAAAAVCHEHIVPIHGVHEIDGLPYLVMQYIAGESLQDRLDRTGPLEVGEIVRIGLQTAQGLAAAHAQGLIHRDIKPANLLLEGELEPSAAGGRVKITDFGLARLIDGVQLTQTGMVSGTPEYMAPEQARGELVDHRADLFSLGSLLYTLCTGVPPFRGTTPLAVLRQVSDQAPTPIRALNPEVPAWLESVIARLLRKEPAERFQSSSQLAALLEGYLAHLRQPLTIQAPNLPASPVRGKPSPKRFGLMALVLLLGLSLIGYWFLQAVSEARPRVEYHLSFADSQTNLECLRVTGDDGVRVKFEPEGLRITVPPDFPRVVKPTGVDTGIVVQGDFEITARFEILQEALSDNPGDYGMRLSLMIELDSPGQGLVKLSRGMNNRGGPQFVSWSALRNDVTGKTEYRQQYIPTTAKTGRLRLVRNGALLSHLVAEGPSKDFIPLFQQPVGKEDLKTISLVANTSSTNPLLDVRITDLHISAESLPRSPTAAPEKAPSKGWRNLLALLGLGLLLALGAWLCVRARRGVANSPALTDIPGEPTQTEGAPASISFPCSDCGKTLKARSALAGKKVKCPQCSKAVLVPQT
jgi:serine/threonine protein kinase